MPKKALIIDGHKHCHRIDSTVGYTRDNVRLVCRQANTMKGELSDSELFQWAAFVMNGPLANQQPITATHS